MYTPRAMTVMAALLLCCQSLTARAADQKALDALSAAGVKAVAFKGGTRVDVPAEKLNDEIWKQLEALGDLTFFSVKGTALDNAALAHLAKIATVESIVIYNPGFDDKGLAVLASLPNFKTLNIDHGLTINGSGLAAFEGKKLESINIGGSKIDDAGMEGIAKVSQLRDLTIRHVQISGAGFANFGKLTGLQKLTYFGGFHPRVNGADLAHLSGLTGLQEFTIAELGLSYDGGLAYLKPLRQLKKLTLKTCAISEADLAKLKADLPDTKIAFTPATAENVKYWNDEVAKKEKSAGAASAK